MIISCRSYKKQLEESNIVKIGEILKKDYLILEKKEIEITFLVPTLQLWGDFRYDYDTCYIQKNNVYITKVLTKEVLPKEVIEFCKFNHISDIYIGYLTDSKNQKIYVVKMDRAFRSLKSYSIIFSYFGYYDYPLKHKRITISNEIFLIVIQDHIM